MIKAVIVDDVEQARETLKEDLKAYCPDIAVIGEAEGVVTGAKALKEHQPEVAFLDIQMQDGSGFDLLEILGDNINFKVIFTTASDAFAIKAFKFSAVDYLLKPIDPDDLMAAVEKLKDTPAATKESIDLLKDKISSDKPFKKLALNTLEKIHITDIKDIIRCESNVNYTMFYFAGGTRLLVTKTLKEFDEMLREHSFVRVHQSHLINAEHVKEFVKIDGGYLVMKDGTEVPVSTRKKQAVMEMISGM
jgi:two-component system LytT family response regulator